MKTIFYKSPKQCDPSGSNHLITANFMKENKISIQINKPVGEVFEFTINPKNTPLWVESIKIEETNKWPPEVGTIYRNQDVSGAWSEYIVFVFDPNKTFELLAKDNNYHVRYTYSELKNEGTELGYFEWVDSGELKNPFLKDTLLKLKEVVE